MARRRGSEKSLLEALEADDNLAILKAQRLMMVETLSRCLDDNEKIKIFNPLTQINKEIIKLEGLQEEFEDEVVSGFKDFSKTLIKDDENNE